MITEHGFQQTLAEGWRVALDPENTGKALQWNGSIPDSAVEAIFPGYLQETLGAYHGIGWYWCKFSLAEELDQAASYILKLGYTDYVAEYWLNGKPIGIFEGRRLNYEFDVTSDLVQNDNLLSVRIINPTTEGTDGYKHSEIPHGASYQTVLPGCTYHYGGFAYPVSIVALPRLRTSRMVIKSDSHTGVVSVTAEIVGAAPNAQLTLNIMSQGGELLSSEMIPLQGNTHHLTARLTNPVLWDIDTPYLYTAELVISVDGRVIHAKSDRFGLREFMVRDGFFFLNGKRIYVKSGHSIGMYPAGTNGMRDKAMLVREFASYKSMGFNMLRFLSEAAYPEQLALCDELGMMVYEEHAASWWMCPNPLFEKRFEHHLISTVRRDINHPSIVIWGLINESHFEQERDCAQSILPRLREEDETRLVLLGSGRWDGRIGVGSVSNPGGRAWECQWGAEDSDTDDPFEAILRIRNMGDIHYYPSVPVTAEHANFFRTYSKGKKPSFLSESGSGNYANVCYALKRLEADGIPRENPDRKYFQELVDKLALDWDQYKLGDVFPFPNDMVRQSYINNVRTREYMFDLIRSNPNFCGYNLTELFDVAYQGGGLLDCYRNHKPQIAEVVAAGFAPLRWSLFVTPMNVWVGKPFTIEAVLANEDVLPPGNYPISMSIISEKMGCVWRKNMALTLPEGPAGGYTPLAFQAFCEELDLNLPEGEYQAAIQMDHFGAPASGRVTFYVSAPPRVAKAVCAIGIGPAVENLLAGCGVSLDPNADAIIVGDLVADSPEWELIYKRVADGTSVAFLNYVALLGDVQNPRDHRPHELIKLPFKNKGAFTQFGNWYYHHETIIKMHPFFIDMQRGMLKYDYWRMTTPRGSVKGTQNLVDTAAVIISMSESTTGLELTGYASGEALAEYAYGKGKIVLSTFEILEHIDTEPASAKLLLNIIAAL